MKFSRYYKEIYITPTEKLGGGHCAYCMDGGNKGRGSDCDMAHNIGLCGCHCCDYFMTGNGGAISFLECSEILRTKEKFKTYYPNISRTEPGNSELFLEHIVKKSILKLYGSMLVLCFARRHSSEAENPRPQEYNFFLVVADASKPQDTKILDGIKRKLNSMRGIASEEGGASCVIREVHVLNAEEFRKRLESRAVPPA